ncbi:LacI family DNA-binding transcriptional regulator [Pedobacter alpinus]|uniref:LacI family DNA-binding transcriptional regulator n=1 Tax=Pedobacter alpinus TaxID=1590643 RepID=A0ABW5TW91_9SPHI
MRPNVTLKKLADMLNLSISTVSRALKDHPDISIETKNKVRELSNVLEYEPNTYAINLRTNNSKEFGVIVPAISNYFYHSFISSLEEEARRYGYSLMILQSVNDPLIELENLKRCKQSRVAGIFVAITSETTDIKPFIKVEDQEIPIIFFDKVPAFEACNKVCVADETAAELAIEALVNKKRKKILALFGDNNLSITKKRLKVIKAFADKKSISIDIRIDHANNPLEASIKFAEAFKKDPPDGVFCMSDEILTGVMKMVQKLTIQIPTQLSIVAISDGFIPQLYYPEIAYAETSGFKLGKLAFSRMMKCMAGHSYAQELEIDSVLIKGGSL